MHFVVLTCLRCFTAGWREDGYSTGRGGDAVHMRAAASLVPQKSRRHAPVEIQI